MTVDKTNTQNNNKNTTLCISDTQNNVSVGYGLTCKHYTRLIKAYYEHLYDMD